MNSEPVENKGDCPVVNGGDRPMVHGIPHERYAYRAVKRVFDFVLSVIFIAVGFLPALVLCVAIVIDSPGASPIYTQIRLGRDGKPFRMYKFRSMIPDADDELPNLQDLNEASGPLFKMKNDPRVTRIGEFIRKHSIDELPQFLNVLAGQMSMVGPRPCLPNEYEEYTEYDHQRMLVKPGCSGYWQIAGRSDLSFDDMVRLDIQYINDSSFATDVSVILKTIGVMLIGRGAY